MLDFSRLLSRVRGPRSGAAQGRLDLPARYGHFRQILTLNNDCLGRLAELQEDLRFIQPPLVSENVAALFDAVTCMVRALESLTGASQTRLQQIISENRQEIERYLAAWDQSPPRRLAASLAELNASHESEAGGKAAVLGEVKNRIGLPVPDGFVITTEAYRRTCQTPHWRTFRDALRDLSPDAREELAASSLQLRTLLESMTIPRAVEVAVTERAAGLEGAGLAVRSSAVGEAGPHSYAGQFLSLLNVPRSAAVDAYRQVLASRFSEHALAYRLAMGIPEVQSPLAVLFMSMVPARVAGILYTRNPLDPHAAEMWISATPGLGLDLAAGLSKGDFVALSRKRPYAILGEEVAQKQQSVVMADGGGIERVDITGSEDGVLSLSPDELRQLATWALKIEDHFGGPQDIEWAIDTRGQLWILQARPLSVNLSRQRAAFSHPKLAPLAAGGQTVCLGRTSGTAWVVDAGRPLAQAPRGSVILVQRVTPEVAEVLPVAEGLVAEWGNLTGHAATLLREFRVPSVFFMPGVSNLVVSGQPVSLDAGHCKLYPGTLWPARRSQARDSPAPAESGDDPIRRRILDLNLVHPRGGGFRASACRSLHDVLRYCHERAVEAMFSTHDAVSRSGSSGCHQLVSELRLNILVLDLGGGIETPTAAGPIRASDIRCRPFQALWKGFTHPDVRWTREMPISVSDLTSVLTGSLSTNNYSSRALGERSYLMVSRDYFNLNARLAYHFTLIDATLTDTPSTNSISFRFAGGGATRGRRNLRACFIEACLKHYGFQVDRRGDLVNAWLMGAPPDLTADRLDIVGRLTASTCQLDMYMSNYETMEWYVKQFLAGNYSFVSDESE